MLYFPPLESVRISIFLYAALGFWGTYWLLRVRFECGPQAAFLGGTLFLFNGFYAHRMIVGHFGYQVFMLLPWLMLLLLPRRELSNGDGLLEKVRAYGGVAVGGVLIAFSVFSGFANTMVPGAMAVVAIACLRLSSWKEWRSFLGQSGLATLIAIGLCASKLSAIQAYLGNFPRSDYKLPGIAGVMDALQLLFTALFISPANIEDLVAPRLANVQWFLGRHEWEYGVSFIPVLIIALYWLQKLFPSPQPPPAERGSERLLGQVLIGGLLGVILTFPLAINLYTPEWNGILKSLPLLKNSSTLIRWWIIYIPIVIVYAAMAFEQLRWSPVHKRLLAAAAVAGVVWLNFVQDRSIYHMEPYNPKAMEEAYAKTREQGFGPEIKYIGANVDANGKIVLTADRNDLIAYGISQLFCYYPSFGYRLENFPVKTLHPGTVFEEKDGYLNIKNPACYIFPQENHCQPGDHFRTDQREQAEAFVHYKPYPFEISSRQALANAITLAALSLVGAYLLAYAISVFLSWKNLKASREEIGRAVDE